MKKILIVDDDKNLLEIYAEVLQKENFEVLKANDGQEAWDLVEKGNIPDVILTGIIMPRMGGFELIAKIKAHSKLSKIPIAIFSHRGLDEDKQKAKAFGVDDFIIQGITTPSAVLKRIKALVGIDTKFLIAFFPEAYDGKALANLLIRQQGIKCELGKEMILELEAVDVQNQKFSIKISCQ